MLENPGVGPCFLRFDHDHDDVRRPRVTARESISLTPPKETFENKTSEAHTWPSPSQARPGIATSARHSAAHMQASSSPSALTRRTQGKVLPTGRQADGAPGGRRRARGQTAHMHSKVTHYQNISQTAQSASSLTANMIFDRYLLKGTNGTWPGHISPRSFLLHVIFIPTTWTRSLLLLLTSPVDLLLRSGSRRVARRKTTSIVSSLPHALLFHPPYLILILISTFPPPKPGHYSNKQPKHNTTSAPHLHPQPILDSDHRLLDPLNSTTS